MCINVLHEKKNAIFVIQMLFFLRKNIFYIVCVYYIDACEM